MNRELAHLAAEGDELLGTRILVREGQHAVLGMGGKDGVDLRVAQRPLEVDAPHLGAAEHAELLDLEIRVVPQCMLRGRGHGYPPSG